MDFDKLTDEELLDVPDADLPFRFWLRKSMVRWFSRLPSGERKLDASFARHLGITPANLSQYLTGNRRPNYDQARVIAAKLGAITFDKLDLPRSVPNDPNLLWLIDNWHTISEAEQDSWIKEFREAKERKEEKQRKRNGNGGTSPAQ